MLRLFVLLLALLPIPAVLTIPVDKVERMGRPQGNDKTNR